MKYRIIINGTGGSGKDTFVNLVKDYVSESGFISVYNISSVGLIKEVARILGWDGKKDEKSRKFLSDLKDLSTNYNNGPINYMIEKVHHYECFMYRSYQHIYDPKHSIIFFHVREPEEIQKLKEVLEKDEDAKTYTMLIDATKRIDSINSNHADANVLNYEYDIIIDNNSDIHNLEENVNKFMKEYIEVK